MKYMYLALLSASTAVAQISDNFSDGNFTENPNWHGIQSHFEVDTLNQLHLNAPSENSSSYLSLRSQLLENATWEMSLKMDFNPSSSNYLDWYIIANDSLLENCTEAYFVRIGNTEDEVALYRQENDEIIKIIDGLDGRVNLNPVEIKLKIERNLGGFFSLWVDLNDGNDWVLEGEIQDAKLNDAQYSGVNCTYTSTRSDKFYFDDFMISGEAFTDTIPPALLNVELLNENQIALVFDVSDFGELSTEHFEILPLNVFLYSLIQNQNILTLNFENSLPINQEFQLSLSSISDTTGNTMNDTLIDFYIQKHNRFDVVINEIMIDPEPSVQLPNAEYLELYNRAEYPINIVAWKLLIDGSEALFDSIVIPAQSYLLLIDEDDSLAFEESNSQALPLASLNNAEGYIGLFDADEKLVHEVYYHKQWYQNPNKENGGWSLEMIDVNNYCSGKSNWKSCENNLGGSPGFVNSIKQENPDTLAPMINEILLVEDDEIQIVWSENLYDSALYFFTSYVFSNELNPRSINHFMNETHIRFFDDLEEGLVYEIRFDSIVDCQGNLTSIDSEFIQGVWPEEKMIYINEILFNPKTDGFDYVELYNASVEYIDLSKLLIGNYNSLINDIFNTEFISDNSVNFPPHSYLALCEDTAWLKANYPSDEKLFCLEVDQLPSFPNDNGSVAISSIAYEIVDVVFYDEDSHFPLLEDVDGVALERLHFDSNEWFSASSTENHGTPARQNSQFVYAHQSNAKLDVIPEVFSPNNDGTKDFTSIDLQIDKSAKTSISIYDKRGFVIKEICQSELVNHNAEWIWDGLDQNKRKLPIGIYMVVVELIDKDGRQKVVKHPVVISAG
jgi:gliding motility-associated-like protein